MNRTGARAAAMKLLYEWEMGGEGGEETRLHLLEIKPDEDETDYMNQLVEGVKENAGTLDQIVEQYAHRWKLTRIARVDLSILRIALYEINFAGLSKSIAVNEALELAHKYSTGEAASFINGVLGSYLRAGDPK